MSPAGMKDGGNEGSIFQALQGRNLSWDTSSDLASGLCSKLQQVLWLQFLEKQNKNILLTFLWWFGFIGQKLLCIWGLLQVIIM